MVTKSCQIGAQIVPKSTQIRCQNRGRQKKSKSDRLDSAGMLSNCSHVLPQKIQNSKNRTSQQRHPHRKKTRGKKVPISENCYKPYFIKCTKFPQRSERTPRNLRKCSNNDAKTVSIS